MERKKFCKLCIDCDNTDCCGKFCHKTEKNSDPCVISDDCFDVECIDSEIMIPIFEEME